MAGALRHSCRHRLCDTIGADLLGAGEDRALDCATSAREAYTASPDFDTAEIHTAGVPTAEALLGLERREEAAQEARRTIMTLTELFSAEHACVRDARELLERAESAAAS
ncbi:hypothetical protein [Streptomyces sp. NPDC002758]